MFLYYEIPQQYLQNTEKYFLCILLYFYKILTFFGEKNVYENSQRKYERACGNWILLWFTSFPCLQYLLNKVLLLPHYLLHRHEFIHVYIFILWGLQIWIIGRQRNVCLCLFVTMKSTERLAFLCSNAGWSKRSHSELTVILEDTEVNLAYLAFLAGLKGQSA